MIELEDQSQQVEQKYGLILPDAYRSMYAAGWMDVKGDNYFWLNDARWMSLERILNHEPEEYHRPGFVPFARTVGGDEWCWWPSAHPGTIVSCPHDFELGDYFTPSFIGFIYRRLLDYTLYVPAEDEQEVRECLRTAVIRLSAYLPHLWKEALTATASASSVQYSLPNGTEAGPGLITEEQYQAILQRDLALPQLNQQFQWMFPLSNEKSEYLLIQNKVMAEADHTLTFNELMAGIEAEKARRKNET